jgi:hypothetical protein
MTTAKKTTRSKTDKKKAPTPELEPTETPDEALELTELDPEDPEPKLCIRVKAAHRGNHVALADRPGGSFATVAKDGDTVEVLAVEGDWYKVAGGYLHKSKTETVQPV